MQQPAELESIDKKLQGRSGWFKTGLKREKSLGADRQKMFGGILKF